VIAIATHPGWHGISHEKGWITNWPKEGLQILWKQPVGNGYSNVANSSASPTTIPQAGSGLYLSH